MAPKLKKINIFSHQKEAAPSSYIDSTLDGSSTEQDLEAGSFLTEAQRNNAVDNNNHGDNPYLDEYRA